MLSFSCWSFSDEWIPYYLTNCSVGEGWRNLNNDVCEVVLCHPLDIISNIEMFLFKFVTLCLKSYSATYLLKHFGIWWKTPKTLQNWKLFLAWRKTKITMLRPKCSKSPALLVFSLFNDWLYSIKTVETCFGSTENQTYSETKTFQTPWILS